MKIRSDRSPLEKREERVAQDRADDLNPSHVLEVSVLFTDAEHARPALRLAGRLAQGLNAHINLVVVKEVPLAFPVDRPPVTIRFTERRLSEFVSEGVQGPLDTTVQLCYCRDKRQALACVLKPKSLVIIGGRKRRWPTTEESVAKFLVSKGHRVIFAADR
jgi:hypothetical protein